MTTPFLLEVIACSVDDAVAAAKGGAGRLEVISHFEVGGLTPELVTVRRIVSSVTIPVRVMLRASPNSTRGAAAESASLLAIAREFAALPIDGFVLGFLSNGDLDEEYIAELLGCAPHLRATFHRAFEEVVSETRAVAALKRFSQFDRILTSGGGGDWSTRIARLASLEIATGPEIQVLAGGGLDPSALARIQRTTGIREFHVGRAARRPETIEGIVDAERVSGLVRMLNASGE
ncbi:MAG: copper homeostasis protein CutC [Acidobacteriota bacterium]